MATRRADCKRRGRKEGRSVLLGVQYNPCFLTQAPVWKADLISLNLDWIKRCVAAQRYRYSRHGDRERQNDRLSLTEVEEALLSARILEHYADTGRGESCLLAGFTDSGKPVHVVCGRMNATLVVITVYIPTPPKFKTPYERGTS